MDRIQATIKNLTWHRGKITAREKASVRTVPRLFSSSGVIMIEKSMTIGDIIRRYPQTLPVFAHYGLDCYECQIADFEDLEHGAGVHKVEVAELLRELNRVVKAVDG